MVMLRISELALQGSPSFLSHRNKNVYSTMLPPKDNDAYLKKKKTHTFRVLIIYLLNEDEVESDSMRQGKYTF